MTASNCPFLTCAPMSKYHFFKYPLVREYTGEVMNGCTFPGRMISSAGAVCFGGTTDTAVRATWAVSDFSFVRALTRDTMPETNTPATTTTAMIRTNQRLNGCCFLPASFGGSAVPPFCFFSSVCCGIVTPHRSDLMLNLHLGYLFARTLQNAEKCWDKKQRRNRGEDESANDRTAEWRILFPAVSHSEGHGDHADDHGQSGHQDGPKAREAGLQRGVDGITSLIHFFRRKAHHQDAV